LHFRLESASSCVEYSSHSKRAGLFYSEKYTEFQFKIAKENGWIKYLGPFSEHTVSCLEYTVKSIDENSVAPIVQLNMKKMNGDVVDQIISRYNFAEAPLRWLVLPKIMGCGSLTVSGMVYTLE
jgi:hypothetical protein